MNHGKYPLDHPQLFLGFDPITGKYKLLLIFAEINNNNDYRVIKTRILTLGTDSSWRKIHMPSKWLLMLRIRNLNQDIGSGSSLGWAGRVEVLIIKLFWALFVRSSYLLIPIKSKRLYILFRTHVLVLVSLLENCPCGTVGHVVYRE